MLCKILGFIIGFEVATLGLLYVVLTIATLVVLFKVINRVRRIRKYYFTKY